jgi:hypothetical protein
MAEAQDTAAEIERLSSMSPEGFMNVVVQHAVGGRRLGADRRVQAAALVSPKMAPRALDALELAMKRARTFLPLQDGETRRQQNARIAPWREKIQRAMGPYQDVVEDLAHEEAKHLAALDDETFARRWAAFVRDEPVTGPVPRRVQALAFRSPRVAARADALCLLMIEEPSRFLPASAGQSRKADESRVQKFRGAVESERRFLRYAIQYSEARQGRMPAEPNVRLQALKLLGERHPEELMQLLRQEKGGELERAAEARRARRAVRRAAGQSAPGRAAG